MAGRPGWWGVVTAPAVERARPRTPAQRAAAESDTPDLRARVAAGDRDAFGQLWAASYDMLFRFVYFRCGNRQLTEDVLSETCVRALTGVDRGRYRDAGIAFGAWLMTIARNLMADHYKSGRYRFELPGEPDPDAAAPDPGPEEEAVSAELADTLRAALDRQLTEEQRECIMLRFYEGRSTAETGLKIGKNDGAVKALQYRAVRALARDPQVAALAGVVVAGG